MPAIAGLARTYQLEWLLMARGDRDLLSEAERLARSSHRHRPRRCARLSRARRVQPLYRPLRREPRGVQEAEQRNAQHADLLVDYADALEHACEPATALQKVTQAIKLNPLCPDRYWWVAGGANFHLKRYEDAITDMSRMRDQSPAFRLLAASHAMLGNREKASVFVKRTKEIHPDFNVTGWLSILPDPGQEFAQHYEQSLRQAGFNGT